MNQEICVYILTHNRQDVILRSLNSVREQDYCNLKIIVSDNSDNDETTELLKDITRKDRRVCYEKRGIECSSSNAHFNYILKTNSFEYFMLFHDDDEMLPSMVSTLYEYLFTHKNLCAVACNAYFNVRGKNTKKKAFISQNIDTFENGEEIIKRYAVGRIAPFPSFMYRKSKVFGISMDWNKGGKYCDCSFIVTIANSGGVAYLPQCCMYYFISPNQDSQHHEFAQYLSLIKYLATLVEDKGLLLNMRLYNIYNYLRDLQLKTKRIPYRKEVLFLFYKYSFTNFFPKYILRLLNLYMR